MATFTGTPREELRFPVLAAATVLGAALVASVIASLGTTAVLATTGALVLVTALAVSRRRELLALVLLVAGMQFMLHKTLGPIDATVQSGANALYVTSVDALLLLLYGFWFFDGTLLGDLRRELTRGVLLLPLVPVLLAVPSLFNADSVYAAFAEVVRMGWMWLLFVYVAVRVRSRLEVSWVLAGLFLVSAAQLAIVLLQWRSGGHLGLGFLGEDQSAQLRSTDLVATFRPTGTAIHPDILAALVGGIGLVGLALALNLENRRWRLACAAGAAASLAAMVLTQTRATLIGFALGGALLVGHALLTGRLQARVVVAGLLLAAVAAGAFWSQVQAKILDNFFTGHFSVEVEARMQLANIASQMAEAHPLAGVGLNNFMRAMPTFDLYGVLYPGYPVHNLPLLVLAETGALGFLSWVLVYAVLAVVAVRLARVRDRLYSAIGLAAVACYAFYLAEEQFSFSLREDAPSVFFWLLAGLTLAAARLARGPKVVARAAP